MDKLTVSLEVAKKLKEAGWEADTYYQWGRNFAGNEGWALSDWYYEVKGDWYDDLLPAPTASEIAEALPELTKVQKFISPVSDELFYRATRVEVNHHTGGTALECGDEWEDAEESEADTIADALALLWTELNAKKA